MFWRKRVLLALLVVVAAGCNGSDVHQGSSFAMHFTPPQTLAEDMFQGAQVLYLDGQVQAVLFYHSDLSGLAEVGGMLGADLLGIKVQAEDAGSGNKSTFRSTFTARTKTLTVEDSSVPVVEPSLYLVDVRSNKVILKQLSSIQFDGLVLNKGQHLEQIDMMLMDLLNDEDLILESREIVEADGAK